MTNPKYSRAYTEVLEIVKYFSKEEYEKIPDEKIEFYKQNMDKDYVFTINPEIDLAEQNISPEANAIIVNLFTDYFATEEQKVKIKEILDLNQKKLEEEKREKYNPDNIFKANRTNTIEQTNETNAMIEYKKDNIFIRIINLIKNMFKFK